jgi:iron complex outermembrane recepter protein
MVVEKMMSKFRLMLAAAPAILACALAAPVFAQEVPAPQEAQTAEEGGAGDIIVTATRRSEALSDIPLAVSAVTAASLANSGASDIRALNQLSPSLLVSSTSSEAAGGGARIRGIGTVGDNPGLESSVATFVDGVYRSRAGVGLSELGAIDRIEVLRGPQGTLFGRNASAGLISVITAKPSFNFGASGEATYGNYNAIRVGGGVTGPLSETIAARVDGVYFKRNGFLKDVVSGRRINNRDRWLVRGQVLFQPNDDLSVRIIGDYADRKEECCGATYLPAQNVTNVGGNLVFEPGSVAGLERALYAIANPGSTVNPINDNTFKRETSITPGIGYRGDVKDWGVSGELNYSVGDINLTSITAYRDWKLVRGQDADFNALSILQRPGTDANAQRQSFQTFTQEVRLQGTAFDDKLDWLVGGYYANETLKLRDNLEYGSDFTRYANCLAIAGAAPTTLNPTLPTCSSLPLSSFAGYQNFLAADGITTLNGIKLDDTYKQKSRNYALFTHNVIKFTDSISLTLGARYTNERKTLDATFTDNNTYCRTLTSYAGLPDGDPRRGLLRLSTLPCAIPSTPTGTLTQNGRVKSEDRLTGTAVLSIKPVDDLLIYASYSRGYKAGGFNLDRSGLARTQLTPTVVGGITATADTQGLTFEPEIVDSFELGYKLNKPGFDLNIAVFYQKFKGFQLNTFNGLNFIVVNVDSCKASLNGADRDLNNATGACTTGTKSGVSSKGLEIEAFLRPVRNVGVNLGLTYTNTRYGDNLVGRGGAAFPGALFQLPGRRLSNSSEYVATGSFSWTPPIGSGGLSGLIYVDTRLQSDTNTGSDLDVEKVQDAFVVTNARIGLRGAEQKWALEFWAQNIFDVDYQQVAFDASFQGGGTRRQTQQFGTASNQLFGAFLGEPRTYGVTARFKF